MKRITLVSLIIIASLMHCFAQPDAISKYFDNYLEDERFTVVYISGKMFSMLSDLDSEEEETDEVLDIAKDLKGLRILIADEEQDGYAFYKEAKSKINTKEGYEVLMTVRDKGQDNVEFLIKEGANDKIQELLLLIGGENNSFVLMSFVGDIDLDKVSKLSKSIEIDGAEHLDKLKDRPKQRL